MAERVTIIGAGLAGCEAALQLAERGIPVRLFEQKPKERTPAQVSDYFCELVCSNSLRGAALSNAVGLLKEEMRRLGSFIIRAADATRVPAGGALAVDRDKFSQLVSSWVREHPLIEVIETVVEQLPEERPLIVATGPLTGESLAKSIAARVGETALAYYDAISPIVSAESINWDKVFIASRWGKGETPEEQAAYVNCPLTREEYDAFVENVLQARKVEPQGFEDTRYFEGCLPIEIMAARGQKTLAFGPMKPVGLTDPKTGRWPYAVIQLRKEDEAGTAFNLVGFQTKMAFGEQARVFRTVPGLENAEFYRFGAIHRNTFINAPNVLDGTLQLASEPGLYFAGQITGTEGYVESAAGGWLAAFSLSERWYGREPLLPPNTTAHGGLLTHLRRKTPDFQPSNITFAHIAPWTDSRLKKKPRYEAIAERALGDLESWRNGSYKSSEIIPSANNHADGGILSQPSS
ncbi:MAG: methylenetetrahydrofolate--tRNA-(uracil(54)-C(5))-methyltransferase (FADH(2)-oxidizing) TrmFO [Polyangiaceae bacterium]|nr:methylenetetrahydrofolate--tRNA-(uracil(54)-C(5))-methyltransferase (FADH(2)-oxidizing) TrmFO [Polyangiaceae bacterium]